VALRRHIGHELLWVSAVTAVVHRGEGAAREVLLVRRTAESPWSSVTGIVDPGEDPAVTAVREAREEASIACEVERLAWVSVMEPFAYDNGDRIQALDFTFRCRHVEGEPAVGDDENVDARWFGIDALPTLLPHHADRIREALADGPETRFER
jgi:8-oxo-dGTP pyrophosphatase MutT (NUDIX family)